MSPEHLLLQANWECGLDVTFYNLYSNRPHWPPVGRRW